MSVKYLLSISIALACILCYCLPIRIGYNSDLSYMGCLLYSFFHANIFHLAVNLVALWRFIPRIHTACVAYVCAVVTAALPFTAISEDTYGLSAFLFAAYARRYVAWKQSVGLLIGIQLALALLPHINWKAHLCAFLMSYSYWRVFYGRKRQNATGRTA